MAAGLAAIFIAGILVSPGVDPGVTYLLGPVAAVVLGGAALSGGLASPTSTWLAAFFVTLLNQMLKVLGLSNASQYVVFGAAIVVGMLISGDRIAEFIGRMLLRPSLRRLIDGGESEPTPVPAGDEPPPNSSSSDDPQREGEGETMGRPSLCGSSDDELLGGGSSGRNRCGLGLAAIDEWSGTDRAQQHAGR